MRKQYIYFSFALIFHAFFIGTHEK
ncbi:hypothetical protein BL05384 [Bacillus licheniformis DSM 13 = ATCC 14580]|uniref:Uncharacterized protein n=1 Tax=Bacillus licheniformis (strain ATCC 14580 / DSM 13 / JCM 2505 / CCUG 7422 / NBRC 12200 / NCIMB 9375 / NCTC 10341 / NRRL NRS-1264 / Gibson 46) TaxID=279010 RepID=Q62NN3_BACLD|nr:hypothetical protein BL05384 [Bacillus licheniformis DSM 13 = ATCC 14580]